MSDDTLIIGKVQKHMESGQKEFKRQAMDAAQARLWKTLQSQFSTVRAPRDPNQLKLYPSESGKCARQVQYKALGIPGEPMLSDVQFKLAMGDLLELALLYVIEHTPGVNLVDNNKIRDIYIAGRPWRGATDGIHIAEDGKKRNVEIKSTSKYGLQYTIKDGVNDDFGYLTQHSVYVRQLLKDGVITEPETIFIYIDRDSMKLWETIVPYDEKLAERADEKFEAVIQAVGKRKMLPRPYDLKPDGSLGLQCSYCSHKFTCWTSPRQVVEFDERHQPQYKIQPEEQLVLKMKGRKPLWYLVKS